MSSRGSKIKNGHVTTTEFKETNMIEDAKVLVGTGNNHGLPDYAHSSNRIYIKENPDGSFRELRKYDADGFPVIEIGYHPEPNLTGNRHDKVLHYHLFDKSLGRHLGGIVSESKNAEIYKEFKKYLEVYGL